MPRTRAYGRPPRPAQCSADSTTKATEADPGTGPEPPLSYGETVASFGTAATVSSAATTSTTSALPALIISSAQSRAIEAEAPPLQMVVVGPRRPRVWHTAPPVAFSTTLEKLSTAGLLGSAAMLSSKPPVLSADPAPVANTSPTLSRSFLGSLSSASSQASREAAIAMRDRLFMCRHSERGANVLPSREGARPSAWRPATTASDTSATPTPRPLTGPRPVITASRDGSSSWSRSPRGVVSTSATLLPPNA